MILRLSQKLNTKIGAGTLSEMPLDDNPYADWSCHLFTAGRTQYIIVSNTSSLYSCVMYARGITDDSHFIESALSTIREFLEADGQAFVYHKFVAPSSATVSFGKALNRSVTGSVNELVAQAKQLLTEEDLSPHDVGFKLNDTLLSVLNERARDYRRPSEAFKLLANYIRSGGD